MANATRVHQVATRPAGPPEDRTPVCRCGEQGPVLVAVWRRRRPAADAELVAVEERHWRGRGCPMDPPALPADDLWET